MAVGGWLRTGNIFASGRPLPYTSTAWDRDCSYKCAGRTSRNPRRRWNEACLDSIHPTWIIKWSYLSVSDTSSISLLLLLSWWREVAEESSKVVVVRRRNWRQKVAVQTWSWHSQLPGKTQVYPVKHKWTPVLTLKKSVSTTHYLYHPIQLRCTKKVKAWDFCSFQICLSGMV
jgi:hypothetical protein